MSLLEDTMTLCSRFLHSLDKTIDKVEAFLLAWSVILLSLLTVGNVISRRLFSYSWSFTEEISQFFLIVVTFAGVGYAARKATHICMTAFYEYLPVKLKKVVTVFISFVTAGVLFYLTFYACKYVYSAYLLNKLTPALQIPFYMFIMIAPIGLFLGGMQYLLTGIKNLTTEGVWLSIEVNQANQHETI